jgi:amino acid transporter
MSLTPTAVPHTSAADTASPPRTLGFWSALSVNLLNMIGIGPFITIPLALSALAGPTVLLGWIAGALLCLCDGLVWAELGSAIPRSGGPYHYLREAYGHERSGRLLGFLYLWQTLLIAPLSIGSAAVGCVQYIAFLMPNLSAFQLTMIAMGLCLFNTALLYRKIRSVRLLSLLVSTLVLAACAWIICSGALHFEFDLAVDFLAAAPASPHAFWLGFGAVTLIAVYDYGGYNNVCMLGGEIRKPRRTIPRAVLCSIPIVAVLYLGLNVTLLGVLPWQQAAQSKAVVADFMGAIYGHIGSTIAVVLIVVASWGSALVVLLGYSRVPCAAASAGQFFGVFARLHPRGGFPTVSLLFIGATSALACLLSLNDLIATLMIIQIMFQFLAQCLAVVLLRKRPRRRGMFSMPLYPLPLLVSVCGWLYLLATSPGRHLIAAVLALCLGTAIYLIQARRENAWPFQQP